LKQAKGFSLAELDQNENTFELNSTNPNRDESSEESIVLDILGDSTTPLIQLQKAASQSTKSNRVDLFKAYQKINSKFTLKRGVPIQEKAVFFELVSTMLMAGISVVQAVRVFSEQTKHQYFKTVAQAISYQLEKGQSLSEIMHYYSFIFNEAEIGMIKSGEITGRLNEVLKRLSIEAVATIELQRKIRSALIYPGIVVAFVILALYAMLRFVIPQMSQLFASTGLELPTITQFLINASNFVVNNGFVVVFGFIGFLTTFYYFYNSYIGKQIFHRLFLNLPILSEFFKSIYQAKFARSISNLLNAGVSIVDAVNITAGSISNIVYKDKIKLIAKDVAQGITISESIHDSPYFSNLTVSMISVGEKTAQMDDLTKQIAEYYESKTADMAENFSKLIQPFVIAIVGAMVGAIVLAIMLPMTELIGGIDSI
jgi:type IV pilus assembly protein PilC